MISEATKLLAHAAMAANLPEVEKALAAGGDPNGQVWVYSESWNTPMGLAVTSMDEETVLRLIEAGGDLGVQQPRGIPIRQLCTALNSDRFAAWLADLPQHRALAAPDGKGVSAGTPLNVGKLLQDAAGSGRPKLLAVLLDDHYSAAATPTDRAFGLINAARINCNESVRLLLAAGAPVDGRDSLSEVTALHWAASRSNLAAATMLIDAGSGLDTRQRAGYAPLHMAAEVGALDVMALLLERGAHPTPQNKYGQTPFDLAIERDSPRAARFLLERGFGARLEGEELQKAFLNAVEKGHARMLPLLASWGADVHQKPRGRTLLQLAPSNDQDAKRVIRALQTGQRIEDAMPGDEDEPQQLAASVGGPSPL